MFLVFFYHNCYFVYLKNNHLINLFHQKEILKKYKRKNMNSIFILIFAFDIYLRSKYMEISIVQKLCCHSSMNNFRIITTLHNLKINLKI